MDKERVIDCWAPPESVWSSWVKPVLFAHLPRDLVSLPPPLEPDLSWVPPAHERWAIVVDLWGVESIEVGLALAARGYRPIPLFNACPLPVSFIKARRVPPAQLCLFTAVDVESILAGLVQGSDYLEQLALPDDAPPAFLLDERRQQLLQPLRQGLFDNRSVVFATDFPSIPFLKTRKLRGVILLRDRNLILGSDLAHVMNVWRSERIPLFFKCLADQRPPQPLRFSLRFLLAGLWVRVLAFLVFRRNPRGGFGDFVPESSSSS